MRCGESWLWSRMHWMEYGYMLTTQLRNGNNLKLLRTSNFDVNFHQTNQFWAVCRAGGIGWSHLGAQIRCRSTMQVDCEWRSSLAKNSGRCTRITWRRNGREIYCGNALDCQIAISILVPIVNSTGLVSIALLNWGNQGETRLGAESAPQGWCQQRGMHGMCLDQFGVHPRTITQD